MQGGHHDELKLEDPTAKAWVMCYDNVAVQKALKQAVQYESFGEMIQTESQAHFWEGAVNDAWNQARLPIVKTRK